MPCAGQAGTFGTHLGRSTLAGVMVAAMVNVVALPYAVMPPFSADGMWSGAAGPMGA